MLRWELLLLLLLVWIRSNGRLELVGRGLVRLVVLAVWIIGILLAHAKGMVHGVVHLDGLHNGGSRYSALAEGKSAKVGEGDVARCRGQRGVR